MDLSRIEQILGFELPSSGGKTGKLRKQWKQEINQYYDIPADYKKLSRTEKEELEDRLGVTSDRITFRKRNPEIDAHLFIAGNLSSLQTPKAKRIAKQIIIEENIKATDLDEDRDAIYKKVLGKFWVPENMGSEEEIQKLPPETKEGHVPSAPVVLPTPTPSPTSTPVPAPTPIPQPASADMAEQNWEKISAVLTQGDLIALQKVWSGGTLTRNESMSLRQIHNTKGLSLGQNNFKTWKNQTLRQVQQNAAVAKKMRNTRELVTV